MLRKRVLSSLFALSLGASLVASESAHALPAGVAASERDPALIMKEVFRTGGFGAPRVGKLKLTVQPTGGEKKERVLRVRYKGDGAARRAIMWVEAPSESRGTGFVSIEYPGGKLPAERWIYLANLKRSSRIAGGQMSTSFLGSDLSFSDLSQADPSALNLKLVKESELVNGEDCWVIAGTYRDSAQQAETGYSEVQAWISKAKLTMVRLRAPLAGSKVTKYMEGSDFLQVGGQWTPKKLVVRSVEDGKVKSETVLETVELRTDDAVSDTDFTKQRLEAGI
ncbi:MAG TPA: outer membrane lipoprotein-sorting protein [Polyangiales bacterium]|nr:outer membrane lipoprotein-sorting protein [Polyangiales bacterium]